LQLVLVRWERPSEATQAGWGARVFAAHGTGDALTDRERIRLAIALGEPAATARALERMVEADSQEEGLFHSFALLDARAGWTLERRQAWISWMGLRGLRMQGGASIGNYVRNLRKRAAEVLTEDERRSLAQALALEPREDAPVIEASFVQSWSEQEVLPLLARVTSGRDFASGKQAFAKARCLECHRMAGEGGDLGHDLTGAGSRYSARDLMLAILEPSREISDQYQDTEVLTRDGELFIGKIVGRTDTTLSILTAPPDEGTYDLDLAEVELERPHPLSRMPAGLLDVLTEEEILNLFAYTLSGGDAQAPAFRD
jgi:putative heme-binding domain-containing protein